MTPRRRHPPRRLAVPSPAERKPAPGRGGYGWPLRGVCFVLLVLLAYGGVRGARGLWSRETRIGIAWSTILKERQSLETAQLLQQTATEYPYSAMAHYLLGYLMVLEQQKRAQREKSFKGVSREFLDAARGHLLLSVRTSLFPYRPYRSLGEGFLLGAQMAQQVRSTAQIRPFAVQAMIFLLRSLKLNPYPSENPGNIWVEAAQAAALAGRPDSTLYALSRAESYFHTTLSPMQAQRVPTLVRQAGVNLADTPLLAMTFYRSWLKSPSDKRVWRELAALSSVPAGKTASLYFLHELASRFPNDSFPKTLIEGAEKMPSTP